MTRSMRPRTQAAASKRDRAEASAKALERFPEILEMVKQLPSLPSNTLERVLAFAARLPDRLHTQAFRIIANELAASFALRYLLLLEDSLSDQRQRPAHESMLEIQEADDAKLVERLLELWAEMPRHLDVRDAASFERFARVTAGLRTLVEIGPEDARDTWVFDSGSEYCAMLTQVGVLPVFAVSAYGVNDGKSELPAPEFKVVQFAGRQAGVYTSQVTWAAQPEQDYTTKPLEISAPKVAVALAS